MSRAPSPALLAALDRRRDHCNALFAEARRESPALEPADVLEHLRLRVGPIFHALPELSPDASDRVLDALYRASLELLARRLGGKHALGSINSVWELLLPRVAPLIAIAPRRVVAALSNAAFNLDQARARPAEWLARMLAVAEHCRDIETLIGAGQVAAWRSGLPQYRSGALGLCGSLQPPVVRALFGWVEGSEPKALAALAQSRFVSSERDTAGLTALGKVGGFVGFGGPFTSPPRLTLLEGTLVAHDHESAWEIHADAFGALLHRRQLSPPKRRKAETATFEVSSDGRVQWGGLDAHFPEIAGASERVADDDLLAVTLPRSHYVYLIAAMRPWPC